jgi:UDP-2,3-diacylglucosamine pyrophosphatase LpxH
VAASYRTLWLSDIHLGTPASRADDLLNFLAAVRADRIYLVGDIVDLQRLKSRPLFPETHIRAIMEFVELAARGTELVYIPGNHDFQLRQLAGRDICGIPVALEACHTTPDGKRLLVAHGDVLDRRIRGGTNIEKFGAAAYALLLQADVLFNRLRRRLGHDYFPISASIKRRLRSANEYIRRFEMVAAAYALARGFDGIVCGHIHRPCIRRIGDCLYANDGDWVEHRTALAESRDGTLEILNWQMDSIRIDAPVAPSLAA